MCAFLLANCFLLDLRTGIFYIPDMVENNTTSQDEKLVLAKTINHFLARGLPAFDVVEHIRKFPKPIAVDFNNVLANNTSPIVVRPEAASFLLQLREIGNVFIVTSATGWMAVQKIMDQSRIWSDDMVLMTMPNWRFVQDDYSKGRQVREEYLKLAGEAGLGITQEQLVAQRGPKRVAPIFGKPWLVPIIDDYEDVTENNPGMLGIRVDPWQPDEGRLVITEPPGHTLDEAILIVRQHFADLEKKKLI